MFTCNLEFNSGHLLCSLVSERHKTGMKMITCLHGSTELTLDLFFVKVPLFPFGVCSGHYSKLLFLKVQISLTVFIKITEVSGEIQPCYSQKCSLKFK